MHGMIFNVVELGLGLGSKVLFRAVFDIFSVS